MADKAGASPLPSPASADDKRPSWRSSEEDVTASTAPARFSGKGVLAGLRRAEWQGVQPVPVERRTNMAWTEPFSRASTRGPLLDARGRSLQH